SGRSAGGGAGSKAHAHTIADVAGARLGSVADPLDRARCRGGDFVGFLVRGPPPPRAGGRDGPLGGARIGSRRRRGARHRATPASGPPRVLPRLTETETPRG